MVTNDARLAWAIARDDGMRSQHEVIVSRLETGCEVQVGAKGGIGAGTNVEYAKAHRCIESMPLPIQSTGDAINCRGVLSDRSYRKAASMAALSAAQVAASRMPGYQQWKPERQRMLYWLALAAVERVWVVLHAYPEKTDHKGREEGRTLDEPWKVGKWLRGKHSQKLDLKNWGKQWAGPWAVLQDAIYELDISGVDLLDSCISDQRKLDKSKIYDLQRVGNMD